MKINIGKKIIGFAMCFLILTAMFPTFAFGDSLGPAALEVTKTVEYYKTIQNKNLTSFWETLALYGAGENIADGSWLLPVSVINEGSAVNDYASAILNELAKGNNPVEWTAALASKQKTDGSFSPAINENIFAIIALDAAKVSYATQSAISFLSALQNTDGGFPGYYGSSDIDVTGMALMAMGRYKDNDLATKQSVGKAIAYLKKNQISTGGFSGAYGSNANTDAASVLGLVAAGEDVTSPTALGWGYMATGKTPYDALLNFRTLNKGFGYSNNVKSDAYATQQVLLALDDLRNGASTIYSLLSQTFVDKTLYFTGAKTIASAGDTLQFKLMGTGVGGSHIPKAIENASYIITTPGGIDSAITPKITSGGSVSATFSEPGTYILTAAASIDGTAVTPAAVSIIVNEPAPTSGRMTISVRIEGAQGSIAQSDSFEAIDANNDGNLSVSESVSQFLDSRWISYFMDRYGYIYELNYEKAGTFDRGAGWLGAVNGDLNNWDVHAGDKVLFFYGSWPLGYEPSTYIPIISADTGNYKSGNPLAVRLTSLYNVDVYGPSPDYALISTTTKAISLPDVDVKINSWIGKTDVDGKITIPSSAINTGLQTIYFSKEKENQTPGIVRTTLKFTPSSSGTGDTTQHSVRLIVKGASGGTILSENVKLQTGDSALSILLNQGSLTAVVTGKAGSRYVRSINGLSEFDFGAASGWMYLVDGAAPSVSADSYKLSIGQTVEWLYTKDLGADIGANDNTVPAGTSSVDSEDWKTAQILLGELVLEMNSQGIKDEFDIIVFAENGKLNSIKARQFIEEHVKSENGIFSKSTDIAKILMAAKIAGMNPNDIGGYDLLNSLFQFRDLTRQGVNAPIFALLTFDALNVEIPAESINTREKLIAAILDFQNKDGGFSLSVLGESNQDLTAMALTSLAKYKDQPIVKAAIESGLSYLSKLQQKDGGFSYQGVRSSETISQVIIALSTLSIGLDDSRFTKEEGNLLSALLSFRISGGFSHTLGGDKDDLATRQAAMALTAYSRYMEGQSGFYDLSGIKPGFNDLTGVKWAQASIEFMSSENIVSGFGDGSFRPGDKTSREQLVKMLIVGLKPDFTPSAPTFRDIPRNSWYAAYVGAAEKLGIIQGKDKNNFGAGEAITRQDLIVMADRMAKAGGIKLNPLTDSSKVIAFKDADEVSDYAKASVARLAAAGMIAGKPDGTFDPKSSCTRAEAAVILYRLLQAR